MEKRSLTLNPLNPSRLTTICSLSNIHRISRDPFATYWGILSLRLSPFGTFDPPTPLRSENISMTGVGVRQKTTLFRGVTLKMKLTSGKVYLGMSGATDSRRIISGDNSICDLISL